MNRLVSEEERSLLQGIDFRKIFTMKQDKNYMKEG